MRRLLLPVLTTLLIVVTLFLTLPATHAQQPDDSPSASDAMQVEQPNDTSSISDSTVENVYCSQPDRTQDACYVNFRYISATSNDPQGMDFISITLDSQIVAVYFGHQDPSMAVTHDMIGEGAGFRVPCGTPGVGGFANLGERYVGGVFFKETASQNPNDITYIRTVYCPAFIPGAPTAVGTNAFSATLDRLSGHQTTLVALLVAVGLLANVLIPRRLRGWSLSFRRHDPPAS